jgi:hypothetical protein
MLNARQAEVEAGVAMGQPFVVILQTGKREWSNDRRSLDGGIVVSADVVEKLCEEDDRSGGRVTCDERCMWRSGRCIIRALSTWRLRFGDVAASAASVRNGLFCWRNGRPLYVERQLCI